MLGRVCGDSGDPGQGEATDVASGKVNIHAKKLM